ncbi:hypothetical protein ACG04Q_08905 [Roseateles sp. DXS20W]|uniref:TonB C-terminal domain-containing protein n=1 Tax=Pelomonas lactea TaxID=3299030 RepID=A0ABW7GIM1_9BURK
MSTPTSLARRLLAGAALLTLAAGPALAQNSGIERVEVRGGRVLETVPRHDVHSACSTIEEELQTALARTWADEGRYGKVKVQFVLENGRVSAVQARGVSNAVSRQVRAAMHKVDCTSRATADAQVYRFSVDFVDPQASADARMAARNIRISSGG